MGNNRRVALPRARNLVPHVRGTLRPGVLIVAVALTLAGCLDPAPPLPRPVPGPAMIDPFADPFVMRIGDGYHAWATGYTNWPFYNIAYTRSPGSGTLHNWEEVRDAMPTIPSWAVQSAANNFWAPSVLQRGPNDFLLYFTAQTRDQFVFHNGQWKGPVWCIGVAHATQPEGPFADALGAPLVCQPHRYGSIDPDVFRDPQTGSLHLYWKSEGWGVGQLPILWHQRLTPDGLGLVPGTQVELMGPQHGWEGFVLENPSMVYRFGQYWLFYSGHDWWTSNYGTGVANCQSPSGPCGRSWSTAMLASGWNIRGPGGAVPVRGAPHLLAYHAWESGKVGYQSGGERRLYFLTWNICTPEVPVRPSCLDTWRPYIP